MKVWCALILTALMVSVEARTSLRRGMQVLDPKTVEAKHDAEEQEDSLVVNDGGVPVGGDNNENSETLGTTEDGESGLIVSAGGGPIAASDADQEASSEEGTPEDNGLIPADGEKEGAAAETDGIITVSGGEPGAAGDENETSEGDSNAVVEEADDNGIVTVNGGGPVDVSDSDSDSEEEGDGDKDEDKEKEEDGEEKEASQEGGDDNGIVTISGDTPADNGEDSPAAEGTAGEAAEEDGIVVINGGAPVEGAESPVDGDEEGKEEGNDEGIVVINGGGPAAEGVEPGAPIGGDVTIESTVSDVAMNDGSVSVGISTNGKKRKFIAYESSPWEKLWFENVEGWAQDKKICEVLKEQQSQLMHDFLNLTCTVRYKEPFDNWCIIDDGARPLWYNTANRGSFQLEWDTPLNPRKAKLGEPQPVNPGPEHEHIVSKFIFLDETTGEEYIEYIEPLVSHLRFPLSRCMDKTKKRKHRDNDLLFRGFVIPPPPGTRYDEAVYFDAGASTWGDGPGGKSLGYFYNTWQDHGVKFDRIYAFESETEAKDFYSDVPAYFQEITDFHQCTIASSPQQNSPATPFVPMFLKRVTKPNDYVVFKLDTDTTEAEEGNIEFILDDVDNTIDEVIWEHHVAGNYLLEDEWGENASPITMQGSYAYFLGLRKKGIRAHSWV